MRFQPDAVLAAVLLAVVAGCNRTPTIAGRVTYEGRPVKSGAISFVPADGQGPSCGAMIVNGRYSLQLAPGKKIVQIVEQVVYDHPLSRADMERMSRDAAKRCGAGDDGAAGLVPPNAEGNNTTVEIGQASRTLDLDLKRPPANPTNPSHL